MRISLGCRSSDELDVRERGLGDGLGNRRHCSWWRRDLRLGHVGLGHRLRNLDRSSSDLDPHVFAASCGDDREAIGHACG